MDVVVCGGMPVVRQAATAGLLAAGHNVLAAERATGVVGGRHADAVILVDPDPRRPLPALAAESVRHLVLVSVARVIPAPGAERWDRFGGADARWSLLRAAVPHQVLDRWLLTASRRRLVWVPGGLAHQPVDLAEVVRRVLALVRAGPVGRVPDLGGPQVVPLADLAATWSRARRRPVRLVAVGRAPAAEGGGHLFPQRAVPGPTWEEHLRELH